jgi:hypothetical protein
MQILLCPPEIVCKFLEGMPIEDVMNATRVRRNNCCEILQIDPRQTCSYFRAISLTVREVWAGAQDAADIPLPVGITLASVDVQLFPRHAYRAILLQRRWKEPVISPVQSSQPQFHELPSWKSWIRSNTPLGFKGPLWCELLPGGELFLVGKETAVGIYDLQGRHGHEFNFEGDVLDLGWISRQNGASLILGLLLSRYHNGSMYEPSFSLIGRRLIENLTRQRVLCIYQMTHASSTILRVAPPRYISLPQVDEAQAFYKGLTMRHSTAVVWADNSIAVVDLENGRTCSLHCAALGDTDIVPTMYPSADDPDVVPANFPSADGPRRHRIFLAMLDAIRSTVYIRVAQKAH